MQCMAGDSPCAKILGYYLIGSSDVPEVVSQTCRNLKITELIVKLLPLCKGLCIHRSHYSVDVFSYQLKSMTANSVEKYLVRVTSHTHTTTGVLMTT